MPNGTYESPEVALEAFDDQRDDIMDFISDQKEDDLRSYIIDSPFGAVDAYQSLLFIAGHTETYLTDRRSDARREFPKRINTNIR